MKAVAMQTEKGTVMKKMCSKCKQYKSLDNFWHDKNRSDGLYYYCKDCCRSISKPKTIQSENFSPCKIITKEWDGNRVVTLNDIDTVHGRKVGTAKKNFQNNKHRLKRGSDYYIVPGETFKKLTHDTSNYNYPRGGTLLTESGYLMVVKSLNDDTAWEVQRKLVETYFRVKEAAKPITQAPVAAIEKENISSIKLLLDSQREVIRLCEETIRAERESNIELRNIIKELITSYAKPVVKAEAKPEVKYVVNTPVDYQTYKRQVSKMCTEITSIPGGKFNDQKGVLHEAYTSLNKQYGIVWDQEKREFYDAYKRSPVNNLELMHFVESKNPANRNLLTAKLNTIYNEECSRVGGKA